MNALLDIVCSKARRGGQWGAGLLFAAGLVAGCSRESHPTGVQTGRPTLSGLLIPRYVSLKFSKVNARGGPGDDYRLVWVYRAKGLPLQVVAETQDWRRICDSEGQVSWVHKRTVVERRTVMRTQARDLLLRSKPDDTAPASATLVGHALADLKTCENGWCRISVGHASGWVRPEDVWGLGDGPQCRS